MTTAVRYTAVAAFEAAEQADEAIRALKGAGFRDDQIARVSKQPEEAAAERTEGGGHHLSSAAGIGMLVGASLGGLVAGAGGVIVAAGPLLAGLLGGGTVGALVGGLIGLGVPEDEARYYEGELGAGRVLLTVQADDRYDEAVELLLRNGGHTANSPLSQAGPGRLP